MINSETGRPKRRLTRDQLTDPFITRTNEQQLLKCLDRIIHSPSAARSTLLSADSLVAFLKAGRYTDIR